jgi:hypothetical protein
MRFAVNAITTGVVLVALVLAMLFAMRREPAPESLPSPPRAAIESTGGASGAAVRIARPVGSVAPREGVAEERASPSLRQRVERLLTRGTPRDKYQAFNMLVRCAHALDFDRYLKSLPSDAGSMDLRRRYGDGAQRIGTACGDLTMRQLDQRLELAASAADDGIPGAATAWIEEGPYGDKTALTQRPDDPLIVEWAQQAIARVGAATKRSDTEAIGQFGMLCLNWELDDVARVRLLVDAAQTSRREDDIKRVHD